MSADDYWNSTTLDEDVRELQDEGGQCLEIITIDNNEKWLKYGETFHQYLFDGVDHRSTGRTTNYLETIK